ncbi:MAG: S-layer homology domain-containing protein [Clostridia bacterium]|nr:S-layer homology domain-containing protein [Clostridia bacterium]
MKKRILSLFLAAVMVLGVCVSILSVNAEEAEETTIPFTDVKKKSWFKPYVERVYAEGIMEGKTDTTFAPNEDMTRAQLVTILYRLAGATETGLGEALEFTDTKKTAWYADYVGWAVKENLVTGYPEGTFAPNKAVSRQEIAKLFVEFMAYLGIDAKCEVVLIESFADAAKHPKWSAEYIEKLRETGLIGGDDDGNFNPKKSASRAEVATILTRYLDIPKAPEKEVSPDGTELHYFGELDEAAFNAWIFEITAEGTQFTTATTEDFAGIVSAYEALGQSDYLRRDIKVTFTDDDGNTAERTYRLIMQEPTVEDDDATAQNIGVEYRDEATGIEFSYLRVIAGEDGALIPSCGYGLHGGHEIRIVRTENGTYATYLIKEIEGATEEHPYWFQGTATAGIIKITSNGFKLLHSFEYPLSHSSHTPNILNYKNGKVYIVNIADDHEKYMKALEIVKETGDESLLDGGAWLDMYELDTNTDTVVLTDSERADWDTHPLEDHGYGKSNPIMDVEHGRIIALFNGGDVPGFFAWFIYDIEKGEWDTDVKTIKLDRRRDYINGYPDGNGGFTFVIQRVGTVESRTEQDGTLFTVSDTYLWDGIFIYNIPDPYVEECKEVEVRSAEYLPPPEINKPQTMNHYGYGGGTYQDFDGNIHVFYTNTKDNKMTSYYAIYDRELNEIKNEEIELTEENGGRKNNYSIGITQGPSGKLYIVAQYTYSTAKANFEIWCSEDGGMTYKRVVQRHELKMKDGTTVPASKIVIANSRSNSILDGTVPLLINGDKDGSECYYNVVLTLP